MKVIEGNRVYYRSKEALARRAERRKERQKGGRYNHTKRAWIDRNPEKRAAHIALGNAVRDGKINKPSECPLCGRKTRIFGHHHDYNKPLDVEWMCGKCHRKEHEKS